MKPDDPAQVQCETVKLWEAKNRNEGSGGFRVWGLGFKV